MKQKICKVKMIFSILVTTILFGISVSANDNITNIEDVKGHGTSYDKIYIDENYRGDAVYNTKYQYVDCKKEFVVAEGNSKYKAIDGVLYSKDGKILYYFPRSKSQSYKLITSAEVIENKAFYNCTSLKKIDLNKAKKINSNGISQCKNLKEIVSNNISRIEEQGINNTAIKQIKLNQKAKLDIRAVDSNILIKTNKKFKEIKPYVYSCNRWYKISKAKGYDVKSVIYSGFKPKDKKIVRAKTSKNVYDKKIRKKVLNKFRELNYDFRYDKNLKIDFFSEYKHYFIKTKVRAYKYIKNKKVYTKWSDYMVYDSWHDAD